MSKRNLGFLLIIFGIVLLLKKLPLPYDFESVLDLLPYLAMVGFGIYLISRKQYQFALGLIYVGAAYAMNLLGWLHIVNTAYFGPSVIISLGFGFVLQGQIGRR